MDHQPSRRPSSSTSSVASNSSWTSHGESSSSSSSLAASSRRRSIPFFTYQHARKPSTCASTSWSRSCEGMTTQETRELWRCMLVLQQRYGCYNSTRIDLAVNAGEAGIDLMPNPFIIDTLNNSLIHLPDQGWKMLDRCLPTAGKEPHTKPKSHKKPWSRN